jgi:hypothetical protein
MMFITEQYYMFAISKNRPKRDSSSTTLLSSIIQIWAEILLVLHHDPQVHVLHASRKVQNVLWNGIYRSSLI